MLGLPNTDEVCWKPSRLVVDRISGLSTGEIARIHELFWQEGAVLVAPAVDEEVDASLALSHLGKEFGAPIFHKLSDENGVHPIRSIPGYSSYANTTSADLLLHTDGSFEAHSPRVMLMLCEQPARSGGLSRICHGAAIYAHLTSNHRGSIDGLMRPDAFSVRRDDRVASKPVFKLEGGRMIVTFRYGIDVDIQVHPKARAGFQAIVDFLEAPGNYCEFLLARHELLVLDNTRVLHGRTAFPAGDPRILHGLWLDGRASGAQPRTFGFAVG
jgi:alpha-ketoglutarate-dependent taurine dioxygenase